jgi:hypothetical protein
MLAGHALAGLLAHPYHAGGHSLAAISEQAVTYARAVDALLPLPDSTPAPAPAPASVPEPEPEPERAVVDAPSRSPEKRR